jgi:uncharacterized protein
MPDQLVRTPPGPETGGGLRLDLSRIAQDLQIRKVQVESVVQLLDEGNTVPFITRYRKERTGGLDEEVIRTIQHRVGQLRQLADRKQTILKSIENQGRLTDELRQALLAADTSKRLEDLYLPYKPKKATLASKARERGLEPLAAAVWTRDPAVANLGEVATSMVNPEKELNTPADVLAGAGHILAELIAETADVRAAVRSVLWETGKFCTSKHEKLQPEQGLEYKDYFQFTEAIRTIPPHRILAINRGEKENALQVKLEFDAEGVQRRALDKLPVPSSAPAPAPVPTAEGTPPPADRPPEHGPRHGPPRGPAPLRDPLQDHPHAEFLRGVLNDALSRLLLPSLEREIRRELTTIAEEHAVSVFARNLRNLLLQPPLHGKRVLALDPGFRTGCKVACLDETGNLLEDGVVYPHQPQNKREEAKARLEDLIRKHNLAVIAIGNGTACRETEELVSELIARLEAPAAAPPPAPEATPAPVNNGTVYAADAPTVTVTAPVADPPAVAAPETPPAAPALPAPGEVGAVALAPVETPPAPAAEAPAPLPPVPESAAPPAPTPQPPPAPEPPAPRTPIEVAYVIVNEAGASVYSASAVGREEFPNFDATLRGTISIGRRLQDPLSELVKIDPQNIGVGLYQHDVSPRQLKESLEAVIESCVNHVGVDLNTASVPLLRHVSGLNQLTARELVEYRKQNGPFQSRQQLLHVPGIGETRYTQAAGFLKIQGGNPLDHTWIHPESYAVAERILGELGYGPQDLEDRQKLTELRDKLKGLSAEEAATRLQAGVPTVKDIVDALMRPGRDPREDLPPPIFKKRILKLEDLQPGMELKGMVLNVVPFGAFVDIGLKDSGLVHISQMANRYVKSPDDVVAVGDVVMVWVLTVDQERRRVSLTMIKPGTERKPPEKRPAPQGERAPREREPGGRPPRGRGPRPGGPPPHGRRPAAQGGRPAGTGGPGGPPRQPGEAAPAGGAAAQGSGGHAEAGAKREGAAPSRGGHQQPAHQQQQRRPRRPTPKPKLTQAALEGRAPLRTFGELNAFFAARKSDDVPPPPPAPPPAPAAEPEPAPAASTSVEEPPKE